MLCMEAYIYKLATRAKLQTLQWGNTVFLNSTSTKRSVTLLPSWQCAKKPCSIIDLNLGGPTEKNWMG